MRRKKNFSNVNHTTTRVCLRQCLKNTQDEESMAPHFFVDLAIQMVITQPKSSSEFGADLAIF